MAFEFLRWRRRKPKQQPPCGQGGEIPAAYVAPQSADELSKRYAAGERYFPGLVLPQNESLRDAQLPGLLAPGAFLRGADLTGANLSKANLEGADLEGGLFTGADLSGACLQKAKLRNAVFHGARSDTTKRPPAKLVGADLQSAQIHGADFRDCDLRRANLYRVAGKDAAVLFDRAILVGATLGSASLAAASFRGARLRGADLNGAILSGADYRQALGGRFDETYTDRMAYASTFRGFLFASPLWFQLRSAYTGVRMVVHLALLTLFVLPHVGEAVMWRAGAAAQQFARRILSDSTILAAVQSGDTSAFTPEYRALRDSVARDLALKVKRALIDSTAPADLCLDRDARDCQPLEMWQILIGWNSSTWIRVGLILAYLANLLRLALTIGVSSQRDSESISGISPSAGVCVVMGLFHWIFRILVLYVATAAVLSVWQFLQQPVWFRP